MIDFNRLIVRRVIIHTINEKQNGQDTATANCSDEISIVDDEALRIIRTRLIDAAGRDSKAFEMQIENTEDGSFFYKSKELNGLEDQDFVEESSTIAHLLARTQRRQSIPGGYLIVMDCNDEETDFFASIVIKAELHEALQLSNINGHNQLAVLDKVFLSPSQKFYKIGIIYQRSNDEKLEINQRYGCLLFDDQFRVDGHLAEYFYKDFLGLSADDNNKIQSKRFYDKTEAFILREVVDSSNKHHLLNALRTEFAVGQSPTVSPAEFARSFIPIEHGLRDKYISEICNELPLAIGKDNVLIKGRLNKREMGFPNRIKIVGPEETFDGHVAVVDTVEKLGALNCNSGSYTILTISGRPYTING